MKDFRSSSNTTEREIYACMVQNLFDEWKFFPKYPHKELEMTAKLFGKIMSEKKIIDGVVTDIGLKCIVEGLKREGKMFLFAIYALEECKSSIESENGLKNILTCQQLQEKKPELFEHIHKRYNRLHPNSELSVSIKIDQHQVRPQNQQMMRPEMPIRRDNLPASNTPDQRPQDPGYNPNPSRMKKPTQMQPHSNTPNHPGKYFNSDQHMMGGGGGGWKPQQQKVMGRTLYQPQQHQSVSARPAADNFSLGPPNETGGNDKRTLNPMSKDFKPKTQVVQEYLKKEGENLPQDFLDDLNTILNMTGTEQITRKAQELGSKMKDEYIDRMAHYVVVKRVIDADDKRISFYSTFFHAMSNENVISSLVEECVQVILKIITNECVVSRDKNDINRATSNPIKNVSYFLGSLTLEKDQPLLLTSLDLKQLLLEAFEKK